MAIFPTPENDGRVFADLPPSEYVLQFRGFEDNVALLPDEVRVIHVDERDTSTSFRIPHLTLPR